MILPAIQDMISRYKDSSLKRSDILREILQQSALLGLSRLRFFEHAAFYGGTALRILYGLDRFSEDLDFSLLSPNPAFDFHPFLKGLEREMESLGFIVEVCAKHNTPPILSAFVKGGTEKLLLTINEKKQPGIHPDEKIRIKLEIDTNPPSGFAVEPKLVLNPSPFYVSTYVQEDLFAGKMHAALCRGWKRRVKGRDWYDLVWFIQREVPVHLAHLSERMRQSGHLPQDEQLDREKLLDFLHKKIQIVDWESARNDVKRFLRDPRTIDIWSSAFFLDLLPRLRFQ